MALGHGLWPRVVAHGSVTILWGIFSEKLFGILFAGILYICLQDFYRSSRMRFGFALLGTGCCFEKSGKKLPATVLRKLVNN